ncbi:MAG: argininosuccinate lyase [Leadbetterella sp.]
MKIWQKQNQIVNDSAIDIFTVGKDRELDVQLARFDVLGSMAHGIMLCDIDLLDGHELNEFLHNCKYMLMNDISQGKFEINDPAEDIHSEIESRLISKVGDIGKKIHSGRSRNDQVLVDLKMYFRFEIEQIIELIRELAKKLLEVSEKHKNDLLPGYTHLQIAMPSSFGLWFGAYAEAVIDDMLSFKSTFDIVNKNPLGSGAGYGSSFPLNRTLTTQLLGFEDLNYNVVYAQMTRGKSELALAQSIGLLSNTLSKFAMDVCLYNSQNFGFIKLSDEYTTGSSIMPHKKNPDVAELLRGKYNRLKSVANEVMLLQSNLPSGYHREFQLTKEIIFPAILELKTCLEITIKMIDHIEVVPNLLIDSRFDLLFSVENVNQAVVDGMPFRDAYRKIGLEIEEGNFTPKRDLNHTLEGSIGNLCTDRIEERLEKQYKDFPFKFIEECFQKLMDYQV